MDFRSRLDDLAGGAKEYVDIRVDEVKAKAKEGLSAALAQISTILLILAIAIIVLSLLAFGLVLLVGDLVGSYAAGCFIVCAAFLILLLVVFLCRKRMFRGRYDRMFSEIFFDPETETPATSQDLKVRRKMLENRLVSDARAAKDYFTPANMVAGFLKRNSDYFNWADLTLAAVRTLKTKLSNEQSSTQQAEDSPQESYSSDSNLSM